MQPRRLLLFASALLALLALLPSTGPARAQADQRCFPETGQCIAGPIRASWERNGGLPVFGFPVTAQAEELVEGTPLQVQWFERDRLEIQPGGLVTAGRLGVERLLQLGTPWQQGATVPGDQACRTFPETGHQVCGAFAAYWQANGGLERFGFPVTGEVTVELEGKPYTVQYFERRRFELHPELGPGAVLLGLLGREVFTARQGQPQSPAPQPPAPQPPTPAPQSPPNLPPPGSGNITRLRPQVSTASWWLSPDGRYVAYLAGSATANRYSLLLVATAGGTPTRLIPAELDFPASEVTLAFSPDSRHVVFSLITSAPNLSRLASKRLPDGPIVQLNTNSDALTRSFRITPDSGRVVYQTVAEHSLVSVPVGGGAEVALTTPEQRIGTFAIAPDGRSVVAINTANPQEYQTIRVPVAGGPQLRLDPGLTAVSGGFIAPNSQRVFLYQRNQLYTVGMDGAGLAALDEIELLDTQAVGFPSSVQSLPDGSAAIYRRMVNPATVVGEVALMRATVGGQPTRLSTAEADAIVDAFWVTGDGQHALYGARASITDEDNRLFSVSTAGGPVVTLPGRQPILPPTDEGPPYRTLPDGPMIAYTAFDAATFRSRAPDNRRVLYLVSVAHGTGVELASRAPAGGNSEIPFVVSGDGSTVAWATSSELDGVQEVYVTDTTRVRPVLVARLAPGEAVANSVSLRLATDGSRLIYQVYTSGPQGERWGDLFSVQVK